MTHPTQLADQLMELVHGLHTRAKEIFGPVPFSADDLCIRTAERLVRELTGDNALRAELAASAIARNLVTDRQERSPMFWRSPLGRQLAWQVGYCRPRVPRPMVHVVLGVSRQRGNQMVGQLSGYDKDVIDGETYVTASAVRRMVRSRRATPLA